MPFKNKLQKYFQFDLHNTNWRTEFIAGLSMYLSLAYIFVVTPSILSAAGMPPQAVLFAAIAVSSVATILMGLWARLPFALAPGLEMSTYIAFFVVAGLGFTWQQSLMMVFCSGLLFIVVAFKGLRERIIQDIPQKMKYNIALAVGAFVFFIGLRIIDVLQYDGNNLSDLSLSLSPNVIAALIGLGALITLLRMRVIGAILWSIIIAALYHNFFAGHTPTPLALTHGFDKGMLALDFGLFEQENWPTAIAVIFTLFVIDFYGSIAKFIGLTENSSLTAPIKKQAPKALSIDGAATVGAALTGVTSITTFVESAVGIGAGGRTGVTAITCGIFMALTLFLAPFIQYVPVAATAPALFYVGYKLVPQKSILKTYSLWDLTLALGMLFVVLVHFSLDQALLIGFTGALITNIIQRSKNRATPLNWVLVGSVIVLLVSYSL